MTPEATISLEERIRSELLVMRKTSDGVTVAALVDSPVIVGLLGDGDPRTAYNKLKHVVLDAEPTIALAAAASSLALTSARSTHLGRLEDFGAEHGYDQRQARRYSDRGVRELAQLISAWAVESVPALDVTAYQVGQHDFVFMATARRHHYVEMRPVRATLRVGTGEPQDVTPDFADHEEGIWIVGRTPGPVTLLAEEEASLIWEWRGELWPKFSVAWRTDLNGHALVSESLGNKMMIRILPSVHDRAAS